ncbi:glycoside hydrolase superfamily [Xylariaceae sp. FL1272]|nr:glycoside hydrolase superfamily [Xylariaceae sp. FL1272]
MLPSIHSLVSGLAVLQLGGQVAAQVADDTYFYGQSPPVYPTPNATVTGDWAIAYSKAQALVSQLSLEEKVSLTGGVSTSTACSGIIPAISRLGFPGLCLSDAGNGVRSTDFVSAWPAGLSVGASWNKNLSNLRGSGMGREFYRKGVNIALGPVLSPLGRIASNGRNWEGFAADPYLTGALGAETIQGVQSTGVITSTKHFIAYEQETNRVPEGDVEGVSSNVDDKTMHELYLWPFQDAVKAGTGNIMCSYNRINNSYASANSKAQNGLLKTELGFQGFIVTDWGAQHAGVATALAGLDMVMPSNSPYWGSALTDAVNNGSVPESRVTDMATRIIAAWYQMGQDASGYPAPGVGMPGALTSPHQKVIAKSPDSKPILLQGAAEGHVLVKNSNGALPLKSPDLISLFGYSAKAYDSYQSGTNGWNLGDEPIAALDPFSNNPVVIYAPNGTMISGGGSGANMPAYVSSPFEALSQRAYEDGSSMYWDFSSSNPQVDTTTDACIVVGNAWATEGNDRYGLRDDFTDALITNVAAQCPNTIVVFHNAGVRLVDQFADNPNVTAIIFAHLPGQDSGRALVSILYGDINPSGKMPYTVPHNETDYGALLNASQPEGDFVNFPQADFSEGVFIDYRAFDAKNVTPRYEFGFGLSYTTFNYSNLVIRSNSAANLSSYPTGPVQQGGRTDLWDVIANVSATITNSGSVAGAEIPQLYVGIPGDGQPVQQLRGFEKPVLDAGVSVTVNFPLTRRDLSQWDVTAQSWYLAKGSYAIYVGASSRDIRLQGTLVL